MGKILTTITIEKRNETGEILESFTQQSRSWVKHFFDELYTIINPGNSVASVNDITGAGRTLGYGSTGNPNYAGLLIVAQPGNGVAVFLDINSQQWNSLDNGGSPGGADLIGIQIGTSNTAVLPTDDKLGTRIAHGEGAGALLYGGCEMYGFTASNPNASVNIRRYFTNKGGGSITVQESGLYCGGQRGGQTAVFDVYCICHDVFAGVTVNNGQILSVVYTVSITV
jgi:hypothetical protein